MQTVSANRAIRSSDGENLNLTSLPRIDFIAESAVATVQCVDVLRTAAPLIHFRPDIAACQARSMPITRRLTP